MTGGFEFKELFEPIKVGQLELKNRIVMPPMSTSYASKEGFVSQQMKDYYEARARGGVGLIVSEAACIESRLGGIATNEMKIDDDKFIPGLSELVEVIKKHGAKVAVQLHHAGRVAFTRGKQPVGPSPIAHPGYETPRELTIREIKELIVFYAEGARRAKEAGFDGIELYAAHQYLLAQFLSPASNKREDIYGGDTEGRARILLEILTAVRKMVGKDYPVWFRINAEEHFGVENDLRIDEGKTIAKMLESAGADAISVSAYGIRSYFYLMPIPVLPNTLVHLAEEIKKSVSIPVMAVGRIDFKLAETMLREKKIDLVCLGRALIADPELPHKLASNQWDDIIPCIACLKCNDTIFGRTKCLACTVNAAVGKERAYAIRPAAKKKRVLVVGGGPAGMEAARVARLRGHQVVLVEKEKTLGGQLIIAVKGPDKDRIQPLAKYLESEINKLGVRIELGREATPALVEEGKFDVIILATGMLPFVPELEGIRRENVVKAADVLAGRVKVGGRVIVVGGELVGCETAAFLAAEGKEVTITRRSSRMAKGMTYILRRHLIDLLREKRVRMLTEVEYEKIVDKGLIINDKEGRKHTLEADTIVLATGARPNNELFNSLDDRFPIVYRIGDCVKPQGIMEAISDGSRVGRVI